VGLSAVAHFIFNIAVTEAGPSAFANIQENYYYVFVGCCLAFLILVYLYFPETKQKTLEEIAAAFGDRVVTAEELDLQQKIASDLKNEIDINQVETA